MYYLVFGIIAIICICGLVGLRRGLFKTLFGFIALILSIVVTYVVNPYVTEYIIDNTEIYTEIESRVYKKIEDKMEAKVKASLEDAGVTTNLKEMTAEETAKLFEEEPDKATQMQYIDELNIPSSVKTSIIENNNDAVYESFGITSFYSYLAKYAARLILNALCFVAIFIVLRLIFLLIRIIISQVIDSNPVLAGVNRLGGFLLGIVWGFALIWIFMIIASFAFGSSYDSMIEGNQLLVLLDKNNLLMKLLMNI